MTQELGRVQRPSAEQYKGRRKLLLVPLIYGPPAEEPEGVASLQKYWEQMQTQVAALETALGGLHLVFHETLSVGGPEGLEQLKAVDQRSHGFVEEKCQAGATLATIEDPVMLAEILDLQRCLMMPLVSATIPARLNDWFAESNRGRYEHMAKRIDETLGEDQLGLLLISERHQIQFPDDIEVFYVSPPALDEFRRWFHEWAARQQAQASQELTDEEVEEDESVEEAGIEAEVTGDAPPAEGSEESPTS